MVTFGVRGPPITTSDPVRPSAAEAHQLELFQSQAAEVVLARYMQMLSLESSAPRSPFAVTIGSWSTATRLTCLDPRAVYANPSRDTGGEEWMRSFSGSNSDVESALRTVTR